MKKKKGTTLVEVLVAIAVFSIISVAMLSSLLIMRKTVARQEEYLRFEMICNDIAFYGDAYQKEWDKYYFGLTDPQNEGEIYYDHEFNLTTEESERVYSLFYYYVNDNELIVSIRHAKTGRAIIEDLNYGGGRYNASQKQS